VPRRLLSLVAVGVVALLSASGCADDVSPAARVGSVTVTDDALMDEAAEWAANPQTPRASSLPVGEHAFATEPVSEILTERIILDVLGREFDRRGLEPAPHEQALAAIGVDPTQEEAAFAGFSDEYARAYVEDFAEALAVQSDLGDDFGPFMTEALADVEIDPRYGTWDTATLSVKPPEAPGPPAANS